MRCKQGGGYAATAALLLCQSQQVWSQQNPSYKLIAPEIAAQGEVFTGIVVKETDQGDVPIAASDGVDAELHGGVVTSAGSPRVTLTAPASLIGNFFYSLALTRAAPGGKVTITSLTHHVEIVSGPKDAPVQIARASEFAGRNRYLKVEGQGLEKLKRAALVDSSGKEFVLPEPAGSSLQKLYLAPADLPAGSYGYYYSAAIGKTERDLLHSLAGFSIDYGFLQQYRNGQCRGCCGGLRLYQILPPSPVNP